MSDFGADDIRLGEAIYRCEAHLEACCELYGAGRKPDALLQAARPMTDVLPWLETEIRFVDDSFNAFHRATSAVGSAIRQNRPTRTLRRALKAVRTARSDLLEAAVGPVARAPTYLASVAVALLDAAAAHYRTSVTDENLGEYQSAYALARMAQQLLLDAGARDHLEFDAPFAALGAVWPSVVPPPRLGRPDDVERLTREVATAAEALGAQQLSWTLNDSMRKIDRLLGDVVEAYERGLAPLAARLAASLFVRAYDPVRKELGAADPDTEARLTALLGFELRTAINDKSPAEHVHALVDEAHALLGRAALLDNAK